MKYVKALSEKVIFVVAIITFQFALTSVGFAEEKGGKDIPFSEAFIPHKNVPGYPRLPTAEADSSGKVNADPQFMADRLAITNLVSAYAYLIDEGRWDEWANLFSDDVVFESTVPLLGRVIAHDKKSLMESVRLRYIEPGKTSIAVRRHTMGNIHVAEQTATTAKVRSYMLISSVPDAYHLKPVTTGTYNAELQKRNGRWVITRWYIETDGFVAPSPEYPGKGYNYTIIPSPASTFPGHKGPAKALPGKVTLKNHAYSMGGAF